jgi:hypothetical protein
MGLAVRFRTMELTDVLCPKNSPLQNRHLFAQLLSQSQKKIVIPCKPLLLEKYEPQKMSALYGIRQGLLPHSQQSATE